MSHWEYFLVLALVFVPTFLFSFHPKSPTRGKMKFIWLSLGITAIIFILWDIWATWRGHWAFNENYTLGLKILNLPLEEVLFFFAIPYSCTFLWLTIKHLNFPREV
jgi:lycopene cyclase domain-containing protein